VIGGAVLLAAAGTAGALAGLPGGSPGSDRPGAPVSEDDVRDVASDFAEAYETEDGAALRRLLTPDVQRVLPAGVARGRSRVVAEYERQFRAQDTRSYELGDLEVQGGTAGRASGTYRVERGGGKAIEGQIVLGVVRQASRTRIALIAVTPRT
jgi:ketosteroid isomerase-like protein